MLIPSGWGWTRIIDGNSKSSDGRFFKTHVKKKVPETGLEPAHLSILDPKSSASTNSAIPACGDFTGRAGRGKNSIGRAVKFQIWVARGGAAVAERVLSFKVLEGSGKEGWQKH